MAVSNSTDFKSTGVQIAEDALSKLGVLAEEEALPNYQLERILRTLTMMLKTWQADGLSGWLHTEGTLTLVDSDKDYVFGSGGSFTTIPFDIKQIRISHDGGSELEMTPLSRAAYYRLPNRTTEGYPTQYFYDRQRDSGTLYLWPVPDDSDYDLTFTYRRRIMDMDAGADNFDLPPEWEEAIVWNLAERLINVYSMAGTPAAMEVKAQAARTYAIVKDFDVAEGEGEISILPDDGY